MEKILAYAAYKKVFIDWIYNNLLGVELEISSRPPTAQGFVLSSGDGSRRGLLARGAPHFNFCRRLDKDRATMAMKKPSKAQKLGWFGGAILAKWSNHH